MSETHTTNLHSECCDHCPVCNPKEDRSLYSLRQKFGKPIYELADRQEDSE